MGVDFFTSLDGPAHLYNARLIQILLFESGDFVGDYFELNHLLVPNWTGHAIMSLLLYVLPIKLVEKTLASILAIVMAYSFRSLLKQTVGENGIWISYFIFPFTLSLTFLLGFYNFNIGLVLLFVAMKVWLKKREKPLNLYNIFVIFLPLITLLYFSHIIPLGLFFIFIFCVETLDLIIGQRNLKASLIRFIFVLVSSIPTIFFFFKFFVFRQSVEKEYLFIDRIVLLEQLSKLSSLIVFDGNNESIYTTSIFVLICFLCFASLIKLRLTKSFSEKLNNRNIIQLSYLSFFILTLFLYFLLPENDGVGGIILPRFQWVSLIALLLFLSSFKFKKWLVFLSISVLFISSICLNHYYYNTLSHRSKVANEIFEYNAVLEDTTIIAVKGGLSNWTFHHYTNLLGISEHRIILKNYEADRQYFPIIWKDNKRVYPLLDEVEPESQNTRREKANYLLIQGKSEEMSDVVNNNYELIKTSANYSLYLIIN